MSARHTRRVFLGQALSALAIAACTGKPSKKGERDAGEREHGGAMGDDDAGETHVDAGVLSDAAQQSDAGTAHDRGAVARAYFSADDLAAARDLGMRFLTALNVPLVANDVLTLAQDTVQLIDAAASDDAAIAQLATRVTADFAADHSYDLEGWVLSRTELELCALCVVAA